MNSFTQFSSTQQSRQSLEHLWQPQAAQPSETNTWLKRFGQWLVQALTDSDRVRLWTKITPDGTRWYAYDPRTQRRFCGASETELRAWLENRFHSN